MPDLISRDEAIAQGLSRYFTGEPCKRGGHIAERMVRNWTCVICLKEKRLLTLRKRRRERPETMKDRDRRHNQRYKDYKQKWARTAGSLAKKLGKQRRRVGAAMPPWVDPEEIKQIYADCPEGMVVDHIVPLDSVTEEGYRVSGLHVPWNLQIITQNKNAAKIPRTGARWRNR